MEETNKGLVLRVLASPARRSPQEENPSVPHARIFQWIPPGFRDATRPPRGLGLGLRPCSRGEEREGNGGRGVLNFEIGDGEEKGE